MDRVVLNGIQCRLRVGVSPEERRDPQDCRVDVEMECDLARAARTDDLHDTIDYSRVFDLVQGLSREEEFALLERFAGRLAEEIRRIVHCETILIRVQKLHPPLVGSLAFAGVEIRFR
ncbi:MAG TPA: dihydroneopterin aldolase [Candidatus Krumholzibacteria bacterium]|nr:dihydroneopterin aldolase [Candidatus Krumholzibacteria bacterium]